MGVHCTIISTSVFGYFQNKILRESYKEGHLEEKKWTTLNALGSFTVHLGKSKKVLCFSLNLEEDRM